MINAAFCRILMAATHQRPGFINYVAPASPSNKISILFIFDGRAGIAKSIIDDEETTRNGHSTYRRISIFRGDMMGWKLTWHRGLCAGASDYNTRRETCTFNLVPLSAIKPPIFDCSKTPQMIKKGAEYIGHEAGV